MTGPALPGATGLSPLALAVAETVRDAVGPDLCPDVWTPNTGLYSHCGLDGRDVLKVVELLEERFAIRLLVADLLDAAASGGMTVDALARLCADAIDAASAVSEAGGV